MQALNNLGNNKKITSIWIPGHQGIHGNVVADTLAKEGAAMVPNDQVVGVSFAVGMKYLRENVSREHMIRWNNYQMSTGKTTDGAKGH